MRLEIEFILKLKLSASSYRFNYHSDQCETKFIVGNVCLLNEANQINVTIVFDEQRNWTN